MGQERRLAGNMMQQLEKQMDLHDIITLLVANRWFIAIITVGCLLLSIFYVVITPPQYSANVLLQVEEQASGLGDLAGGSMMLSPFRVSGTSPADVQSVLIKSRYILEPVVQKLGLDLDIQPNYFPVFGAWYAHHHSEKLSTPPLGLAGYTWGGEEINITEFTVPASQENHLFLLVAQPNNSYQLYDSQHQLLLTGKVGEMATHIVSGLGQFTINVVTLKANPGARFSIFKKASEKIIDGIAKRLEITDLAQVSKIQSKTGVLQVSFLGRDPDDVVTLLNTIAQVTVNKDVEKKSAEATKTLEFLNQQLPLVKKSLDEAEITLNNYQAKTGTINLGDAVKILLDQVSEVEKQLNEIQMERAAALQKYTPAHPFIIALNDKEAVMQKQLQALQTQISKLPASQQSAIGLMRDVRVKSHLYLLLLNKMQALQVSKAGTISNVRILSFAEIPDAPVPLHKGIIFLGALLFGAILGSLFVIVKHALHCKVSDPNQIETQFGLSNMAIVPFSEKQKEIFAEHNPKLTLVPLLAKNSPRDLSIEALRSFRTSLQFAMLEAKNNIITIMGIAPGVGKSFVSANFAYLVADAGKKVLLIDGDIRKGHLKDYFKIGSCKGLGDILAGTATLEQALISGPIANLDFLATGAYPPNPSEILTSAKFKQLLEAVSKQYDLVIIDTAPILAVTDAALIGQHAGANFMVIASDMHEANEIEHALKRFEATGVKINGVIFNFKHTQKGVYRYGYGYRYNYQYKYD